MMEPVPPTPFDDVLRASRRLDWRFLLADPTLGQVGYIGPRQGRLLEALEQFSAGLRHLDDQGNPDPAQVHDVVVVSDPTADTVRRAVACLRPDGWLYAEVHGWCSWRSPLRSRRRPGYRRRLTKVLRRLGMREIEAYWHWPDFESSTTIVPLDDRVALSHAVRSRHNGAGTRAAVVLARGLLRCGLLEYAVPCFSVLARREGNP